MEEKISTLMGELEAARREIEERKILRLRDKEDAERAARVFKERLTHELGFDYSQYKIASDMEMTVMLGEILRDRLRSVFKILRKNGFNFEQ
jgi:hypothetical protein